MTKKEFNNRHLCESCSNRETFGRCNEVFNITRERCYGKIGVKMCNLYKEKKDDTRRVQ